MPGFDEDALLQAIKAFYTEVPMDEKMKLVTRNFDVNQKNFVRGLSLVVGNRASHRYMYDMGIPLKNCSDEALRLPLYEDTPFPPDPKYKWIQDFFNKQYDLMHA